MSLDISRAGALRRPMRSSSRCWPSSQGSCCRDRTRSWLLARHSSQTDTRQKPEAERGAHQLASGIFSRAGGANGFAVWLWVCGTPINVAGISSAKYILTLDADAWRGARDFIRDGEHCFGSVGCRRAMRQGHEHVARIVLCKSNVLASLKLRASQYMPSNVALLVARKAASIELGKPLREAKPTSPAKMNQHLHTS